MKRRVAIYLLIVFSFLAGIIILTKYPDRISNKYKDQWSIVNYGDSINGIKGTFGLDLNLIKAWGISKGSDDVIIAIIDSGVDLIGTNLNLFQNENEISGDGIDNDHNGYIDDITGWDFYHNDNTLYDGYLEDYHGTYIANLVGSQYNDEVNYSGIVPGCRLLLLKALSNSSGDVHDIVNAIEYAYTQGAKVVNCSWDFETYNIELYEVIKKYPDMLFICPAGKRGNDIDKNIIYPSAYGLDNILTVTAMIIQENCVILRDMVKV